MLIVDLIYKFFKAIFQNEREKMHPLIFPILGLCWNSFHVELPISQLLPNPIPNPSNLNLIVCNW